MWTSDDEMFRAVRRDLFPAVVGDVMDAMGLLDQFLPAGIQPLRVDMVLLGRAMPVLEQDITDRETALAAGRAGKPFGRMLEALDDLRPNEVYVCTGCSLEYAAWGELMSRRALRLGATGALIDGYSRDTHGILAAGFPTFSRGRYARDQRPRGQVVDFRVPVTIGGVKIAPGDIVFGDVDGVLAIPRALESEILVRALDKVAREAQVRQAFDSGDMTAAEAVEKFGAM